MHLPAEGRGIVSSRTSRCRPGGRSASRGRAPSSSRPTSSATAIPPRTSPGSSSPSPRRRSQRVADGERGDVPHSGRLARDVDRLSEAAAGFCPGACEGRTPRSSLALISLSVMGVGAGCLSTALVLWFVRLSGARAGRPRRRWRRRSSGAGPPGCGGRRPRRGARSPGRRCVGDVGLARLAHADQVRGRQAARFADGGEDVPPQVGGGGVAVQEDHRRSGAELPVEHGGVEYGLNGQGGGAFQVRVFQR